MAFLASKFRNRDLTRKSILFLTPSPRGASAIGVTAALATAAPLTPTPPTGGFILDGGIGGYPVVIKGLVMTRKCPSQGRVRGKTRSGTAPSQSTSNRGAPRRIVLSGRLRSDSGLEWLGRGGEGRAYLQGGKPLLELPTSSPQTFLLNPLTSRQDLTRLGDAYAFYSPRSIVSRPGGDISYRLTGSYGLVEQEAGPGVCLFPIKGQHVPRHA